MQDKMSGTWEVLTNGSYCYQEPVSWLHRSALQDPSAFRQHTQHHFRLPVGLLCLTLYSADPQ